MSIPDFSSLRAICTLAGKVEKSLSESSGSSMAVSINSVNGCVSTVKYREEIIYSSPICADMSEAVEYVDRFHHSVSPERLAALIREVDDKLADRSSHLDLRHAFRYTRFGNTST